MVPKSNLCVQVIIIIVFYILFVIFSYLRDQGDVWQFKSPVPALEFVPVAKKGGYIFEVLSWKAAECLAVNILYCNKNIRKKVRHNLYKENLTFSLPFCYLVIFLFLWKWVQLQNRGQNSTSDWIYIRIPAKAAWKTQFSC